MKSMLARLIATGVYTGYAPVAPGTFGSAFGLLVVGVVQALGGAVTEVVALVLVTSLGIWASHVTEVEEGREDPGIVVIDEVAGMLVTLLWIPLTWESALVGFFVFRLFDIIKPFPARRAERLPGGLGVMVDDLDGGSLRVGRRSGRRGAAVSDASVRRRACVGAAAAKRRSSWPSAPSC